MFTAVSRSAVSIIQHRSLGGRIFCRYLGKCFFHELLPCKFGYLFRLFWSCTAKTFAISNRKCSALYCSFLEWCWVFSPYFPPFCSFEILQLSFTSSIACYNYPYSCSVRKALQRTYFMAGTLSARIF